MNSEDEEAEIKKFVQKKLNLEKQIKGLENEIREKLIAIEIETSINQDKRRLKQEKLRLLKSISEELEQYADIKNLENKLFEVPQKETSENVEAQLQFCKVLNFSNVFEGSSKLSDMLEEFETKNDCNVTNSERFRFVKYMGNLFDNLLPIFKLDLKTFSNYQDTLTNLNELLENNVKNNDSLLNEIITINIFVRLGDEKFNKYELLSREINLGALSGNKVSFLQFDEKFTVIKKYSIGELKLRICNSFQIDMKKYIAITKNFEVIPYNIDIYHEIYHINLEKKFIESSSRFFQFNPFISQNFSMVLVHIKSFEKILYKLYKEFPFYADYQPKNMEKEKIKSRITQNFAKLTDEIRIDEFILSINPEENVTLESNIRVLISELVEYLFDSNLEKKVELFEPRQIIKIKAKKKQYNTSIITNEKDKAVSTHTKKANGIISIESNNVYSNNENYQNKKSENSKKTNKHLLENSKNSKSKTSEAFISSKKKIPKHSKNFISKDQSGNLNNTNSINSPDLHLFKPEINNYNNDKENEIILKSQKSSQRTRQKHTKLQTIENMNDYNNEYLEEQNFSQEILEDKFEREEAEIQTIIELKPEENQKILGKFRRIVYYFDENPNLFINICDKFISDKLKAEQDNLKIAENTNLFNNFPSNYLFNDDNKILSEEDEKIQEMERALLNEFYRNGREGLTDYLIFYLKKNDQRIFYDEYLMKKFNKEKKYKAIRHIFHDYIESEEKCIEKTCKKNEEEAINNRIIVECEEEPLILGKPQKTLKNSECCIKSIEIEKEDCNESFLSLTSYTDMNDWILNCYYTGASDYFSRYTELVANPVNSIFIFYFDIQINYVPQTKCPIPLKNNTLGSSMRFIKDQPNCYRDNDTSVDMYREGKAKLFDLVNLELKYSETPNPLGFLDYLFFQSFSFSSPNVISINKIGELNRLFFLISFKDLFDFSPMLNKYENKMENLILQYNKDNSLQLSEQLEKPDFYDSKQDRSEVYDSIDEQNLSEKQFDFIDSNVQEFLISTFFLNQDLNQLGILFHYYSNKNSIVDTQIIIFGIDIYPSSLDTLYDVAFTFLIISLILTMYIKYRLEMADQTAKLTDYFLGRGFYLIIAVACFIFESIYRIYHILLGTNNAYFAPSMITNNVYRDRFIYFKQNLMFFKGSEDFFLCIHMIYVIFSDEDLFIMKNLFDKVTTVFFIILIIVCFAIAVFLNLIFGTKFSHLSDLLGSFIFTSASIFSVDIPIEASQNKNNIVMQKTLAVFLYFLKMISQNFILVFTIYKFQGYMFKKIKKQLKDQELNKEKLRKQIKGKKNN